MSYQTISNASFGAHSHKARFRKKAFRRGTVRITEVLCQCSAQTAARGWKALTYTAAPTGKALTNWLLNSAYEYVSLDTHYTGDGGSSFCCASVMISNESDAMRACWRSLLATQSLRDLFLQLKNLYSFEMSSVHDCNV
jgi:hypothetical protein